LSQEDLGDAAGLHRTYVGHLERGEVNPSLLNILKVSAALGIDASELVSGLAATIGDPRLA
jgi:transcriptional regulator with XRE-family HTH domain